LYVKVNEAHCLNTWHVLLVLAAVLLNGGAATALSEFELTALG
jgi:hypothetical protein